MGYYTKIAQQSFKTAPTGERVFLMYGILIPGYVIPDEATEKRLYTKHMWSLRILQPSQILLQPFLLMFLFGRTVSMLSCFLVFLAAILLIFEGARHLIFRNTLRGLPRMRLQGEWSFQNSFSPKPVHRRELALFTRFTGSVLFIFTGMLMLHNSGHWLAFGSAAAVSFAVAAFGWRYAMASKSQKQDDGSTAPSA